MVELRSTIEIPVNRYNIRKHSGQPDSSLVFNTAAANADGFSAAYSVL
jgi:hypothetical protein